eukprot:GHRR01017539.1.p1 GENE.GHRR01017539.1~~GHRR01017539.1.p1  ORF type:complete len:297 (+),score=50.95 GHRR01017539.1:737-1627(+)
MRWKAGMASVFYQLVCAVPIQACPSAVHCNKASSVCQSASAVIQFIWSTARILWSLYANSCPAQSGHGAQIGVFNHVSYLDAWVVVWAFCCAGVTFEFAKRLPILGYGVRALQNLYVPEEADKAKQQGSLTRLIRERAANRAMPMLSVAPEGTLSHGRCMLKFKTGAFVPAVPVVPILLRYKLKPHNPAWTIIITPWHLLRLMCQFRNHVTVEMLPPYIPSQAEKKDPVLYAANVRKLMANALGIHLCDEDRSHFLALVKAGVGVSWDGRRITAPPGVVNHQGMMNLEPYMRKKKD